MQRHVGQGGAHARDIDRAGQAVGGVVQAKQAGAGSPLMRAIQAWALPFGSVPSPATTEPFQLTAVARSRVQPVTGRPLAASQSATLCMPVAVVQRKAWLLTLQSCQLLPTTTRPLPETA
ncbi:MAG: hypothetical protein ACJ8AW_28035 [Rhodopila sp.]